MTRARVWPAVLTLAVITAASFAVVAPPERCPTVTAPELRRSAQATVDWFVRNQGTGGTWLYEYNAEDGSTTSEYNEVRHAGVTMGLYQAAAARLPGALRSADRGNEWARDRLIERDGWTAFAGEGRVTTGATALLTAGLTIRREATGDSRYDRLLRRLGRFLIAQSEPSGAVLAGYDLTRGEPVPGKYSKYYTGEAYWALARLHKTFPGEGWGKAADRTGAYLASSRDEAEDHWPPIPDHWAAYGASETVGGRPLTEDELSYARGQAGLFGVQARWVAQRFGPWGELVRGTYTPRGGGYGVIGEALTGWWLTARAEPSLADLRAPIADRATCIAGLAMEAQSNAEDAAGAASPDRVKGAWFLDGETRMDDQQHALSALLRTVPIVEAADDGPGDSAPSAWLWIAVLVLALNPVRAAFGVSRAERSPRSVATGGAIGGLIVCAAAAAGGPLLEALDVSDPSFRIAAGIVAGLAGIVDVFRKPPSPESSPVMVVARPALLVMALGAGADQGVVVTAAAMAVGVALLTGLVARWPTEDSGGRLRWASRLLAVALVAGGVLLTLDGVTAV